MVFDPEFDSSIVNQIRNIILATDIDAEFHDVGSGNGNLPQSFN
jgi:hypothetical protein